MRYEFFSGGSTSMRTSYSRSNGASSLSGSVNVVKRSDESDVLARHLVALNANRANLPRFNALDELAIQDFLRGLPGAAESSST